MNTYSVRVIVEVTLDAFNADDAAWVVEEAFAIDSIGATLDSFVVDEVTERT